MGERRRRFPALFVSAALGLSQAACGASVPERRWLEPVPLAASTPAGAPALAANSRGDVVAAWMQGTGNDLGVWSRSLVAGAWTQVEPMDPGQWMQWEPPQLALNEAGVAFGLWIVRRPYPYGWLRGARRPGAGWESPQLLNEGTSGGTPPPRLSVLGSDGALAVWKADRWETLGSIESVQWSRFDPRSGWAAPVSLGPTVAATDSPLSWSDEAGHAFVLWRSQFGRWVARYLHGGDDWGSEQPLPAAPERSYRAPTLAVAPTGALDLLWREYAGGSTPFVYERVWANRFLPGSGFTELVALDATARIGCRTELVGDGAGALAVWCCRTDNSVPNRYTTWYSQLSRDGSWTAARPVSGLPATAYLGHVAGDGSSGALAIWSGSGELWGASLRRADWEAPVLISRPRVGAATVALRLLPSGEGLAVWVEGEAGASEQIRSAQYADPAWRQPHDVTGTWDEATLADFSLEQLPTGEAVLVWSERAATRLHPSGVSSTPRNVWSGRLVAR